MAPIPVGLVERTAAPVSASPSGRHSGFFGTVFVLLGVPNVVVGPTRFPRERPGIFGGFVPAVSVHLVVVAGSFAPAGAFVVYTVFGRRAPVAP